MKFTTNPAYWCLTIFLVLFGLSLLGLFIPGWLTGIFALAAGILMIKE
jgi:hypothetical protein